MHEIKLLGKHHLNRMLALLRDTRKINESSGKIDIEYGTAYYLLSADEDILLKARKYINADGIAFKNMIAKQDFSSGQMIIVKLDANLFNWKYKKDVSPIDIIGNLDNELFDVAICAILLRRDEQLSLGILVNQIPAETKRVSRGLLE